MSIDYKRPVGRPKGTTNTPRRVLDQDLQAAIKLNKEIRDLVEQQIAAVREEVSKPEVDLGVRLKIIAILMEAIQAQSPSIDKTAKHLLTEGEESESSQPADEQSVLEMFKGR